MRTIKVVPAFVNRAFSVPFTSNLRPVSAQKRLREVNEEQANKRQRVEQLNQIQDETNYPRDLPMPTTESEERPRDSMANVQMNDLRGSSQRARSHTGASWVLVQDNQTGRAEFAPSIKQESPELGLATHTSPMHDKDEIPATDDGITEQGPMHEDPMHISPPTNESPLVDMDEETAQPSPQLTTAPEPATEVALNKRKDIYDVPSSPEFVTKSARRKTTYGRSPRTPATFQREVDLLNCSRFLKANSQASAVEKPSQTPLSSKARAFQMPRTDDIESTQEEVASAVRRNNQAEKKNDEAAELTNIFLNDTDDSIHNDMQTPVKSNSTPKVKAGNLRKPTKTIAPSTPITKETLDANSIKGTASSTRKNGPTSAVSNRSRGKKLDPEIQARLDRMDQIQQAKKASSKATYSESLAGESPATVPSIPSIIAPKDGAEDTAAFKKPSLKAQKPTSGLPITNDATKQPLSEASNRRSTPRQSKVPLPDNVRHLSGPQSQENRHASSLNISSQPALANEQPSSSGIHTGSQSNVGKQSPEAQTPDPASSQRKKPGRTKSQPPQPNENPTTPLSQATQPKKRGRPPKKPVLSEEHRKEPPNSVSSQPAKGSHRTTKPKAEPLLQQDSTHDHRPATSTVSANTGSKGVPKPSMANGKPISISSRESSSEADSASEPSTQIVNGTHSFIEDEATQSKIVCMKVNPAKDADHSTAIRSSPVPSLSVDKQSTAKNMKSGNSTGHEPSWSFERLDQASADKPSDVKQVATLKETSNTSPESDSDAKSRSASVAISTRSSPAVTRGPARFLSHSPTPEAPLSEDGFEENSVPPPSAAAVLQTSNKSESVSESDSSSDPSASGDEDEDTELPNAAPAEDLPRPPAKNNSHVTPSSPPLIAATNSTLRVRSTSRPISSQTTQQTPVHPPNNVSPMPPSSQLKSSPTVSQRRTRYSRFRSLREQLAESQAAPASQIEKRDPRMQDLRKLSSKPRAKPAHGAGPADDDSDEESSHSSSDSD